ncbi:trypsin-like peptidase domain-containing protein [Micromonospora chersina]|uniref:Trypsin-like peptidase domain-containing protein n=1 Tax=Micromonospora chersina TaxID=47854 RepID=A0A1C6UZB5_9ACTN|nr:trypsin-like peptidase domain-containing protein [Micromonospora chersina]SCL59393.1 Trypsin-like peptidase domain-containing protein [Micromonospora chersina]
MQPVGPYRLTEVMGVCQVGKAWWAVDGQDRLVTIAVLDPAVAQDPAWRQAFSGMAETLAAPGGSGRPYLSADFAAKAPWAAYIADGGPGAEHLFFALGQEIRSEQAVEDSTVAMLQVPTEQQPQLAPWALQGDPRQAQQVSSPPQQTPVPAQQTPLPAQQTPLPAQQVSAPPQQVSAPPQQVSAPPQQVSAPPQQAPVPQQVSAPPVSAPPQPAYPHTAQPVSAPPGDPFSSPVRRIQPSPPRPPRQNGLWAALAALLLVAVVAGGVGVWGVAGDGSDEPATTPTATSSAFPSAAPVNPGLKPWAQAALRSPEEHALATAGPSMVFVEVIFTGYVRNKQDNALLRKAPITFNRRCSGFVVNSDGHVLTNTQCVRPTQDILLGNALGALANAMVAERTLNSKDVAAFTKSRMKTAVFTGTEAGTEPEAKLYGQLNVAKGDTTDSPAIPGAVVQSLALDAGNLALVKLEQGNLPAAELNPSATIAADTSLLILGYNTTDTSYRSATYSVTSKPATVTGVDAQSPVQAYRINDDLGLYSRGGIAIDPSGRVVGMLDNDILRPDKANRFVVPVSTMAGLLSTAGVQNTLGDADKRYRSGLDAYFAGQNSTAAERFGKVAQDSPTNVLAQVYRQAAIDSGGGESSSGGSNWAVPVLAAAAGALVAGLVVLVVILLRRRNSAV